MNRKNWIAALAACVLLPAAAQTPGYTPTAAEAKQARENAQRDAKMADAMEKARKSEDAMPVAAYIPKQEPAREAPALKHPEVFTAKVPGSGKKPAQKTTKKAKTAKHSKTPT